MVTHDLTFARRARRMVTMEDGNVVQDDGFEHDTRAIVEISVASD